MKIFYLVFHILRSAKKSKHLPVLLAFMFFATMLPVKLFAQAPTISYSSPQAYLLNVAITPLTPASSNVAAPTGVYGSPVIIGSGLLPSQNGVAIDAAGNIYVSDINGSTGEVKKIAADGSSTTIIGSGFSGQSANVAVDKNGNVYVADQSSVWKIPASGSPVSYGTPVVINTGLSRPFGIAIDAAGNLYVTDLITAGVYKMANDGSNKVEIDGGGLSSPTGVAVDVAGNVYVVDSIALALYEIFANGNPQVQLASGFSFPRGVAVDGAGNIYVDDQGSLDNIYAVPAGGGSPVTVGPGFTSPVGVAVDAAYNLYVANQGDAGIDKISPTGGYFISPVLLPAGLSFDNTTGIISGTPTALSRAKNYVISAYNGSGGASATVNIAVEAVVFGYASPQTYTAGAAITPLAPTINTGTVASPGYSAAPVTIATGFLVPLGMAVDTAGNVYVADKGNSLVKEIPKGCKTPVSIGTGFNTPSGVAVDGKGNVYVADQALSSITEIPVGGGPQVSIGSGFTSPAGVAIDSTGNIYVADAGSYSIYKIAANSGFQTTLVSGFVDLTGIAADAAGDLYVSDGSGKVYRISAGSATPEKIHGSFNFPANVAVDASGNVYVADSGNQLIYKIPGGRGRPVSIGGNAFSNPTGVAVSPTGVVYVGDAGPDIVEKIVPAGGYYINRSLPTGLRFSGTTGTISGAPKRGSPATNYTVTGYNSYGGTSALVNITVTAPPVPIISYSTPQVYTAGTAITPLTPSNIGGGVATPGYSIAPDTLGSGFANPGGVAVDGKGNVYVADAGNHLVKMIPAGGGTPVSIGGSFINPTAVAIDSLGNVYVVDEGNNTVNMITAAGGLLTATQIGTGIAEPNAVAADAAGDVFVTDVSTESVYEIPTGWTSTVTIAIGFGQLTGIAADAAGNIYVADALNYSVYKNPTGLGGGTVVGPAFVDPTGVGVDAMGDVYVADQGTNTLYKISTGRRSRVTAIGTGFNGMGGVAADGSGNVYIADIGNNAVEEITPVGGYYVNRILPAGLSLDNATGSVSGTATVASAATDYTITAYNAGGGGPANLNITVTLPPPPTLSYTGPQTYTAGTAITPLTPGGTGVDVPVYNSTLSVIGTGFTEPQGVAVDTLGNVYVADPGNTGITEILAGGGTTTIASGSFIAPLGVAVDASGNIYVADFGTGAGGGAVYKIPVTGGTPGAPVSLGNPGDFGAPGAVAVDAAGNVYVGDLQYGSVDEIPAAGGNTIFFNFIFGYPGGLAVDAAGNIYVADSGSGGPVAVYKLSPGGGSRVKIGHGFNLPTGVAVDPSDNVYVADGGSAQVKELPAGGGPEVIVNGFSLLIGIAADGKGNIYVSDDGDLTIKEVKPAGGYYIRPALPAGLSFNTTTGAVSGTPTAASPATNYTISAYNYGGGVSAGVNIAVNLPPVPVISYNSPNIYDIGTLIAALSPANIGGTVGAPAYSGSSLSVGPTFVSPAAVASDAAGNLYVADYTAGAVGLGPTETTITKIPVDGTPSFTIGSGFNNPQGVAVDAAGNVYVGDTGNNTVEKIPFSGGSYGSPVTIASGLNFPVGVAVDIAGNVYVADFNNNAIKKINFRNGAYASPVAIGSGFNGPVGVAVDAAGNVYVADTFNSAVKMIPLNVTFGSPVAIGSGFQAPFGVAVDAGGNVFVSDAIKGVFEIVAPVTGVSAPVAIGGAVSEPGGVTADAAGNIYVADDLSTMIKQTKPIGGYYMGPFLPAGLSFDGTTGIISGTPTMASPATNYTLTAYNYGGGGQATVNIEVASNNDSLSNLVISKGTLTPVFVSATTSYTDVVSNTTTSITITPTTNNANATIKVNGNTVTSGSASGAIPLNPGPNTVATVVTAQDGITTQTYTTTVTRTPLTNAYLSFIGLNHGVLSPVFAKLTTTYTESVASNIDSIEIRPVTNDPAATVTINGIAATSGIYSSNMALSFGANTFNIVVTAQDGSTTMTYTVIVTRPLSSNAYLSFIGLSHGYDTFSPVFAKFTTSYTETVAPTIDSVEVRPVLNDTTATVMVNGTAATSGSYGKNIGLSIGQNTINIVVKAQDGSTTMTYTVIVTRPLSNNAYLSFIGLNHGYDTFSPVFAKTTTGYTETVAPTIDSVEVRPVLSDTTATVMVNGTAATSGSYGKNIGLSIGQNTINIVVKAQDGSTTTTYTVIVTRSLSSNAYLSFIGLNHGYDTFSPVFAKFTTSYTETVPLSIDSIEVRPVLDDTTATVTVNGTTATSGSYGKNIGLSIGQNTINIVVTAQDGSTMLTYTVTVTRAAAPGDNALYEPVSVVKPKDSVTIENDGIIVHQGVSPNGDGINDFLLIEGITNYPDNHLMIINRNGALVYQTKGYDNSTRIFDGHSNINGSMQLPGTYFYSLDYTIKGETKHKTGFIVLKY